MPALIIMNFANLDIGNQVLLVAMILALVVERILTFRE